MEILSRRSEGDKFMVSGRSCTNQLVQGDILVVVNVRCKNSVNDSLQKNIQCPVRKKMFHLYWNIYDLWLMALLYRISDRMKILVSNDRLYYPKFIVFKSDDYSELVSIQCTIKSRPCLMYFHFLFACLLHA